MSFTYKPNKRKRAKTHGFLVRSKTAYGRNTLKRRRQKGRKRLVVSKNRK
ncbi:MAG: 50S ribosomal protein L34 [Patescibacteria group bacterium]|nr:50S ribosomal protein L34 [Patescibacteria group bacterium]MDE1945752.1 50S ribosomal protein L34 [Patescibacteria group bacterium]